MESLSLVSFVGGLYLGYLSACMLRAKVDEGVFVLWWDFASNGYGVESLYRDSKISVFMRSLKSLASCKFCPSATSALSKSKCAI